MQCEMQTASFMIWTLVTMFISYKDNHYITSTSNKSYNISGKFYNYVTK